jgi:hypothetical protein
MAGLAVGTITLSFLSKLVELIVAELTILIGGGVFVLVDPSHKRAINRTSLSLIVRA